MIENHIEYTSKQIGVLLILILIFVILMCSVLLSITLGLEMGLLAASVLTAPYILLLPIIRMKSYDIFQPLSLVILSVVIGVTVRSFYILLNPKSQKVGDLLMGESPEFLISATFIILIGLVSFVLGYLINFQGIPQNRLGLLRYEHWNERRLFAVVLIFVIISIFGMRLFLRDMGFSYDGFISLSQKRFLNTEDNLVGYTALGYHRWAASLGQAAFTIIFTWFAATKKKWVSSSGIAVIGVFLVAVIFPFFVSKRGELLWLIISSFIIWHYLRKRLPYLIIFFIVVSAVIISSVMIGFRPRRGISYFVFDAQSIIEDVVVGRDLLDITTTAFIIDAVHEGDLEYRYGGTYFTWIYAPIPRVLWKNKPIISVGADIKQNVYGFYGGEGGIPPGIIGEGYWNLGVFGVVLIMFLVGIIMKIIYQTLITRNQPNSNFVLIYAGVLLPWSLGVLGGGWSNALISVAESLLPILIALYLITDRSKNIVIEQ
jgi:oligosaccharide repeat unit polymerase